MTQDTLENKLSWSQKTVENIFDWRYWLGEIDTRWLSIFRILFSLVLLKDAIYHLVLAEIFYSDVGVVPRVNLFDGLVRVPRFSLMDAIGEPWLATLFFIVWIIVLIGLLLGYRTRLMTILNFIIILSVHERNGYILTSADTLMRVMCFWMMLAPMGQYYSLDAIRQGWRQFKSAGQPVDDRPRTAFALPIRLMQWQLVIVYVCTAYLKTQGALWVNGDALHYIAQINTMLTPMGEGLRLLPAVLLKMMTYYSMLAEIAIPLLLLSPFFWRWSRAFAFSLALTLHGGIALMLSIPDFSIVMLLCYLPFFDPAWLQWLSNKFKRPQQPVSTTVPSDSNSPLWLWLSLCKSNQVTVQSPEIEVESDFDTWQVHVNGEPFGGQSAWRAMSAHLPFSRLWDWLLIFRPLRQLLWWLMGMMMRRFGDDPLPLPPAEWRVLAQRFLMYMLLVPLFIILIWWNVAQTSTYTEHEIDLLPLVDVIWYTGLWQFWDMFSPLPIQHDGWIIIEGQFEDGTSFDLITGQAVDYETATRWYAGPEMRWEKFEENVFVWQYPALLRGWGDYYCRTINADRDDGSRLATMQIYMNLIPFHAPDEAPNEYELQQLWFHWCFGEYAPQS